MEQHGHGCNLSAVSPQGRSLTSLALALGLLAGVLAERADSGEAMRVKGTSVRLTPPEGFVPAERFAGFQNEGIKASIQVSVLAGPVSETKKVMNQEDLAKSGMTLVTSSIEKVNGADATVVHVVQTTGGTPFSKCLVVAGDEKATVLLVATVPSDAEVKHLTAMRAAMLAATWDAAAPADLYEGLPFRLVPAGTLTDVRRVGNNLLLTEHGRPKEPGPRDPMYIAGISHSATTITDLAAFSRSRVMTTTGVREIGDLRGATVKVAGLDGYELMADAMDAKSGTPMFLYQVIVSDGPGYWMVVGMVALERTEKFLPTFRKITESIQRTPVDEARPRKPEPTSGPSPDPKPER